MKGRGFLKCAALLMLAAFLCAFARAETDGEVRVLLTRIDAGTTLEFTADGEYILAMDGERHIPSGARISASLEENGIIVSFDGAAVNCGAQALFRRAAETSRIRFGDVRETYPGDLLLGAEENSLLPVLRIDVEDYVCGALLGSMQADDPTEALKAQAVAARSYALHRKAENADAKYDLTDEAGGVRYVSGEVSGQMQKAAEATRGEALWSNDAPVRCVSRETNGGSSENTAVILRDASDLKPELKTCLVEGMAEQLGVWRLNMEEKDVSIIRIEDIARIDSTDPILRFTMEVRSTNISSGKPISCTTTADVPVFGGMDVWYGLSADESDRDVRIESDETALTVSLGDGASLSRSGARALAQSNVKYAEILSTFFPNARIKKLALQSAEIPAERSPYALPTLPPMEISEEDSESESEVYGEPEEPMPEAEDEPIAVSSASETDGEPTEPTPEADAEPAFAESAAVSETNEPAFAESGAVSETAAPSPAPMMLTILTPEPEDEVWSAEFVSDDAQAKSDPAREASVADAQEKSDPAKEPIADDIQTKSDPSNDEAWIEGWSEDFGVDEIPLDADEIPIDASFAGLEEDFDFDGDSWDEASADDSWGEEFLEDDDARSEEPSREGASDVMPMATDTLLPEATDAAPQPIAPDAMTPAAEGTYRYVNVGAESRLTLRAEPSTESGKVTYLGRGVRLRVLEIGGEWAHVETERGRKGYVSAEYLSETEPEPAADDPLAEFKRMSDSVKARKCSAKARTNVHMRKEPNTDSAILLKIIGGKKVQVIGEDGTWAYVRYKDKNGYVMKKYLKFSE